MLSFFVIGAVSFSNKKAKRLAFFSYLFCLTNCSTPKTLKIIADGPSDLTLVSSESPDRAETKLGRSPIEIEFDKVNGKLIKITQAGKLPQFILPLSIDASSTTVSTKLRNLSEIPEIQKITKNETDPNVTHRLLMQAYDAMVRERNFDRALRLADDISKINASLAAPYTIKGLIFLQQGQSGKAKMEFQTAKEKDPVDMQIDSLLRAADEGI